MKNIQKNLFEFMPESIRSKISQRIFTYEDYLALGEALNFPLKENSSTKLNKAQYAKLVERGSLFLQHMPCDIEDNGELDLFTTIPPETIERFSRGDF